ncbi:MAG: beta-propeller fold lactonase family protein, partial [Gammaproteobacteria bacterium]
MSDAENGPIPVGVRPFALDVLPDGSRVYVPNHDSGSISVIDTARDEVIETIAVAPNPHWVDVSRDGSRLYAANHESNVISTIDTATDRVLATVPVGTSPHSILAHPDLPYVYNVNYDDSTLSVQCLEMGADDFLRRGCSPAEIMARVRAVLRLKAMTDELRSANHRLRILSFTDELTGLANMRSFNQKFS